MNLLDKDPLIVAQVIPGLPSVESLGPLPVLQTFGGITVLLLAVLAFVWGMRNKQAAPSLDTSRLFLDGPVVVVIEHIREMTATLKRLEQGQLAAAQLGVAENQVVLAGSARDSDLLAAISRKLDDVIRRLDELLAVKNPRGR